MPKSLPYYPYYVQDFDEDEHVLAMNLAEVGLYQLALNEAWKRGSIPDDPKALAIAIRKDQKEVKRAWPKVRGRFIASAGPDRMVNARQEKERIKALSKCEKATASVQAKNQNTPGFVYLISRDGDGAIKIGSSLNVARRLAQLKYKYRNYSLTLLGCLPTDQMGRDEVRLHAQYAHLRVTGEWYMLRTEDLSVILSCVNEDGDSAITPPNTPTGDNHDHPTIRAFESGSNKFFEENTGIEIPNLAEPREGGGEGFGCRALADRIWEIHPSPADSGGVEQALSIEKYRFARPDEFDSIIISSIEGWVEYWETEKRYATGLKKWIESGDWAKKPPYKRQVKAETRHPETSEQRKARLEREDEADRKQRETRQASNEVSKW